METRKFLRISLFIALAISFAGCHSTRLAESPSGPHFTILTYNVNWAGPRPDLAVEIIRQSRADIVCLQETTPEWEKYLRRELGREFSYVEFRNSEGRMGGGLAFLARVPAHEVAYVPSDTGWFDGWIVAFETANGPVQVVNVHLRPPVSDGGSWVSGYFSTGDDRLREMKRFYERIRPGVSTLIAGDFNDSANGPVVSWLQTKRMTNALPEFDYGTPTWQYQTSVITLSRRMDHIVYSPELHCCSARVVKAGASDHFPVTAIFTRAD